MKRKLKEELVKLCTEIITSKETTEISPLYIAARELYEKLAVLKYIEEKLNDIEIDVSKNVLAAKFEMMANAVINENRTVPENSPHDEDIITPGIDTIKHMVSEMPTSEEVEKIFAEFVAKKDLIKSDKDWLEPDSDPKNPKNVKTKSLNDILTEKELSFGLNDRLAFVKHLFNGNTSHFDKAITQLNAIDTEERSLAFIENLVKPEFDNWTGQEEYEKRFTDIIRRRFA
ncbi:MAG: hypothetical protein ABF293_06335 [Flavobacteriaceae bacterium]